MSTQHSPLPWGVTGRGGYVAAANRDLVFPVAPYPESLQCSIEDARFIVTACNAHHELIAALRGISNAYASDGNTRRQRGAFAVARALLARLDAEAHQ